MATTFNWIYLGNSTTFVDPTEGNASMENPNAFAGQTFGTSGSPIYLNRVQATTIDRGGEANTLDTNNSASNDQIATTVGGVNVTLTYDGLVVYGATVTYVDGTTATVSAVLVQTTSGDLFLAPELLPLSTEAIADTAAYEAKPIQSITFNTALLFTNTNLGADRQVTGWDDGIVDGTAGNDLINASYVEPVSLGSDRIDNNDGLVTTSLNDDRIRAGAGNDTVFAGLGNDVVFGGTGLDVLNGDAGNDTLYGEDGGDSLLGGDNADLLYGGLGVDTLFGGGGNDSLYGGDEGDQLFGGGDQDTLYGEGGNDTLQGDLGNDQLYGGADNDLLDGGDGLDVLYGGAGIDRLDGNAGNDLAYGGTGADLIYGGTGQDTLFGDEDSDVISGGSGNDRLTGGTGADTIFGGDDRDEVLAVFGDVLGSESVDGGSGAGTSSDNDTLSVDITGFGWTRIELTYDPLNDENGTITFLAADGTTVIGVLTFTEIENLIIVCFTAGTRILTATGPVAVEELRAGDLVVTRDNGQQPLRWVGSRTVTLDEMRVSPDLQPVRFAAGALGDIGPDRAMMLSPQHRLLIEGARAEMYFGESEVLVPSKHLVGLPGVTRALPAEGVTYVHILFDRHEIVLSDGIWTESFQPAERTLNAMEAAARAEVLALFPALQTDDDAYPAARLSLKAHEARVLLSG